MKSYLIFALLGSISAIQLQSHISIWDDEDHVEREHQPDPEEEQKKNKYYDTEEQELKTLNERIERPESYESNIIFNTHKAWYKRDMETEKGY